MATAFREWPWPIQVLAYGGLALVIFAAGNYAPSPVPISGLRQRLSDDKAEEARLRQEVAQLQFYERRHAELQAQMEALKRQLETLRLIVPEEKEIDQFILLLQGAATQAGVSIRRLTAKPVVTKEYHYEMPFEVEADGPYYNILDFFSRLSRLSRIINVGDINFKGLAEVGGTHKFRYIPGTTVTGTMAVVTFFTKTAEAPAGPAGPAKPGAPGAPPAKH